MSTHTKIKIAQIGCGYWGPNLLRNFQQHPNSEVIAVADPSRESREHIHSLYPEIPVQETPDTFFTNLDLDAVVTPLRKLHWSQAKTYWSRNPLPSIINKEKNFSTCP
jgi:predicted dehydrogenase